MNTNKKTEEREPTVPADLKKVLESDPLVEVVWKSLTTLSRWDYVIWVEQAKLKETREHRIKRTFYMMKAGKKRPCCFTIIPADLYKAMEASSKAKEQWKTLSGVQKREFVSWLNAANDKNRANQACELLESGEYHPKFV